MTTPPRVRPATPDEWSLIGPIERAAGRLFVDSAAPELVSDDVVPDDAAQRYTAAGRVLVAELDDHVVGFVGWHAEDDPSCLGISQISVLPEYGRRGIGTALMRSVIEVAVARGCRAITLNTQRNVPWNEPWYLGLGFTTVEPGDWTNWMTALTERQRADGLDWDTRTWMRLDIELLQGGIANAGAVARVGTAVSRPANPHSAAIHDLLNEVRDNGFKGASAPLYLAGEREQLTYVEGDVPLPPYPPWAQTERALASIARLIRGLHDASGDVAITSTWSDEMADRLAVGDVEFVVGHNDVCLENVVFRDGEAVALLDFDFAAPGRREWDLAAFARMCVPIDDDPEAERLGWAQADRPARLRLVCDAYGLDASGRAELLSCLDATIARGGAFVLRHVEAGEQAFIDMWEAMGGMGRFDRRRAWWAEARPAFANLL